MGYDVRDEKDEIAGMTSLCVGNGSEKARVVQHSQRARNCLQSQAS